MKLEKRFVQLSLSLLILPLCGCASSKLSSAKVGKEITPGMARIHFKRSYSIVGAANSFYVLDWGTGIQYDTVMGAGPNSDAATSKDGDKYEAMVLALTQEKADAGKCVALRGTAHVDVVADATTGVPKPICTHRDLLGQNVYTHESGTLSGRLNAALIGRIGPGATLTWDRPPGIARFKVDLAGQSSPAIPLEAGKEYRVVFHYIGGKFDVKEGR
jgi:hypothetical protein